MSMPRRVLSLCAARLVAGVDCRVGMLYRSSDRTGTGGGRAAPLCRFGLIWASAIWYVPVGQKQSEPVPRLRATRSVEQPR